MARTEADVRRAAFIKTEIADGDLAGAFAKSLPTGFAVANYFWLLDKQTGRVRPLDDAFRARFEWVPN